jgi:hypothetical protein
MKKAIFTLAVFFFSFATAHAGGGNQARQPSPASPKYNKQL